MKKVFTLLIAIALALFTGIPSAMAQTTDFESFTLGSVNYQGTGSTTTTTGGYTIPDPYGSLWTAVDEWGTPPPTWDEEVIDDGTGNMVWRLSNAVSTKGYSNMPISPSSASVAGESTAALWNDRGDDHTSPLSPPNARAYASTKFFHSGFKFKSATGASQTDLSVACNPQPRQTNIRTSYVGIEDVGTGFDLIFYETSPGSSFDLTTIATNLSYAVWHELDIYIEFVDGLNGDGSGNDIVSVMLDGAVIHTGTTWESYYSEISDPKAPYAADALMFRVSSGAAGTSGNGLFFDDVTIDNAQAPGPVNVYTNNTLGTLVSNHNTIQAAINEASTLDGHYITVAPGTYTGSVSLSKEVTLLGANAGIHPAVGTHPTETVGSRGAETIISGTIKPQADNITLDGLKFTNPTEAAIRNHDDGDARNFIIRNCVFEVSGSAGEQGKVHFYNKEFANMLIEFNLFQNSGTTVQDNDFKFENGAGGDDAFDGLTVRYNKFNSEGEAMFGPSHLENGVIQGNEFDGTINGVPGVGFNTMNIGDAGNLQFLDNYVHDVQYTAIQAGVVSGKVSGNQFENIYPYSGNPALYGGYCIYFFGGAWGTPISTDIEISGNTFTYNTSSDGPIRAIRLAGPENTGDPSIDASTIHVHDNQFYDAGAGAAVAIRHQGDQSTTVDATCNWFADAAAPTVFQTPTFEGPANYIPYSISPGGDCIGGLPTVANIATPTSTTCGILDVPVTVENFNDVGNISLRLNYDETKLQLLSLTPIPAADPLDPPTYLGITLNPDFAYAAPNEFSPGEFRLGYYVDAQSLDDDEILFTLHFNILPSASGTTDITWDDVENTGNCEFAGAGGTPVYNSEFNDKLGIAIPTRPVKNIDTGREYCKIQDAIDDTETLDGHTIVAEPGNYPENVLVNKRLTIQGAGPNQTTVQSSTNGADVIRITEGGTNDLNRTVIKDLKVTSTGTNNNGIKIDASDGNALGYITIENVHGIDMPGSSAGIRLHGTTVASDIITDVKLIDVYFADNKFGLYSKNAQVHAFSTDGEAGRSLFENNRHSGILFEGGTLVSQFQDFVLHKTDLSGNNSLGDTDPGHGEMFLLGFNGDLDIDDMNVTSGIAAANATPWYIAVGINGCYGGSVAPSGIMSLKNMNFTDVPGALHFPRASLGIWTFSNLDNGVVVDNCSFDATGASKGGLYLSSLSGTTPLTVQNSIFGGTSLYNSVPTDIYLLNSTVDVTATTGNTFTGTADNFAIEDRIWHEIEDADLGFVTVLANNAYVTDINAPATAAATNNDYTRIRNAVELVDDNWTINLHGTFDWTESNAAASWALGNDDTSGNDDDYTILVPAGLTGVTFTAPEGLGNARISGPGDLSTLSLEGTLSFWLGNNQNWTISNMEIFDFDMSIGMFNNGTTDYNNMTISNNHIRIPKDLNKTVAPDDAFQNIGIHYSFGTNQTISNNTFDVEGDGVSDGTNYSTSIVMQSNTSGGTVYDGLTIINNTINVLGVPDASEPALIRGIWENGHNSNAAIEISGNVFTNAEPGNTADLNRQFAFWVTSASGDTKKVEYKNNEVTGFNEGIGWLGGPYTSYGTPKYQTGQFPVEILNNKFDAMQNAIVIRKDAASTNAGSPAYITGNSFINPVTGGLAIKNEGTGDAEATCNWYGTIVPSEITALISGTVTYTPWLTDGADLEPGTTGFQPLAGGCDDEPPVITLCAGPQLGIVSDVCTALLPDFTGDVTVTDNNGAGNVIITQDTPEGTAIGFGDSPYTVTITVTDEAGNSVTCTTTFTVEKASISGTLVYNNGDDFNGGIKEPMNEVILTLTGGPTPQTATTGINGDFVFTGLCEGDYTIEVTDNPRTAGYINSTDAGAVSVWSVGGSSDPIEHVKYLAGDVTYNKFLAAEDALAIQANFVFGTPFAAPDEWSYWKAGEIINSNEDPYDPGHPTTPIPWPTDITVTVNGDVTGLVLYGMGTGDFNGSFVPPLKSASPSLMLAENGNLQVGPNQEFELPLRAERSMDVSAVSMILDIPSDLVKVQDVLINGSNESAMWAVKGNELRIGWHSVSPVNVGENESLVTLKLKTSDAFAMGQTLDIKLPYDPRNELADGYHQAMENASLLAAKVGNGTVGTFDLDTDGKLSLSNYPNPFSSTTTLEYKLPVDGDVNLSVYNSLGQLVSVVVDQNQQSGRYSIRYDDGLQPGVYVAKLRLINNDVNMVGTIKLSVTK